MLVLNSARSADTNQKRGSSPARALSHLPRCPFMLRKGTLISRDRTVARLDLQE